MRRAGAKAERLFVEIHALESDGGAGGQSRWIQQVEDGGLIAGERSRAEIKGFGHRNGAAAHVQASLRSQSNAIGKRQRSPR